MPFGQEPIEDGVGLALSGGGFRATLFHAGTLWRLNELGWLGRLSRISSVSGGSITAGALAVRWPDLAWVDGVATNFPDAVVRPLRAFTTRSVDTRSIFEGILSIGETIADAVREELEDHLVGTATLAQLPETPRFVFNATNLSTGVSFRFSKPYAGDYRIGLIPNPRFGVALAIGASAAFPPVLSPVKIAVDPASWQRTAGADLYDDVTYRTRLLLSDGGVYDNMGLETVWRRYRTILVSDAGAPFPMVADTASDWLRQTVRVLNIAVNQSRALRKRALIDAFERGRAGTYWGIATDIAAYGAAGALPVRPEVPGALSRVRTRLNPFTDAEQCTLINWGYAIADAAMRRGVLPASPPPPPSAWPYPDYRLDRPLPADVHVESDANLGEFSESP
jgi:NTE family protein